MHSAWVWVLDKICFLKYINLTSFWSYIYFCGLSCFVTAEALICKLAMFMQHGWNQLSLPYYCVKVWEQRMQTPESVKQFSFSFYWWTWSFFFSSSACWNVTTYSPQCQKLYRLIAFGDMDMYVMLGIKRLFNQVLSLKTSSKSCVQSSLICLPSCMDKLGWGTKKIRSKCSRLKWSCRLPHRIWPNSF